MILFPIIVDSVPHYHDLRECLIMDQTLFYHHNPKLILRRTMYPHHSSATKLNFLLYFTCLLQPSQLLSGMETSSPLERVQ